MGDIATKLTVMRHYFDTGITQKYDHRLNQLNLLNKAVNKYEQDIYEALFTDLHKCKEECWVTENGLVMAELKVAIHNLKQWMKPDSVPTNLANFLSSSKIIHEPFGVVLIIGPWNYPFQLLLIPLIGALAAGNCVVLKSSEFAPATSKVVQNIIRDCFTEEQVVVVEGEGATVIPEMMNAFRFDHVFYTGSTAVGKIIYKMAAENLCPVTLELGGKSPCIVESDADMAIAAKRIAMPKFANAGQICIAPDYVLVHESRKNEFVEAVKSSIQKLYGTDPINSNGYGRIINEKQFDRILRYMEDGNIVYGGNYSRAELYIEPTVIDGVTVDSEIMKNEIFGPLLPILTFKSMEEAKAIVAHNPNPLALYIFTNSIEKEKAWMEAVPSGGVCINSASLHFINHHLPFGGRGSSGIGAYHGKFSFDTFSHRKAVLKSPTWFDPSIKYPPFEGKLSLLKWLIG